MTVSSLSFKILLLFAFLSKVISAQTPNYSAEFDLGEDGNLKKLLFFDKYNGEFEKTEFTNLKIVSGQDTFSVENDEVWVVNSKLKSYSDEVVGNRIGIKKCDNKYYLILIGFQYGCCRNKTSIYEWTGTSLLECFNQDFEVKDISIINGKHYLVGDFSFSESYGDCSGDFYFNSFSPTEYRSFSDSLRVDKSLTQERNQEYSKIEKYVDVYAARLVRVNVTNQTFMISESFEKMLKDREFGVVSLTELPQEYLQQFDRNKLSLMRNELFAYHGYKFKSQKLKTYFENKYWYNPTKKSAEEISIEFSEIEKKNIAGIITIEKKLDTQ